ncbi:dihydrodipicolinate synthase family protein, partial [Pseudomonas sp. p99-361]|uniref:dihydrodipicolinate synthase family protein n=1 Tax=Pseudomonas sp. p99-361 TaxID=2479852 RepID=UPI000FB909AB
MIRGSIAALVTPMDASGAVDLTALDCLIDMHLHNSTHGLVAVGTTGESATLNINEHVAVIERVVTRVAGRIPVIAGTGSNCTKDAPINLSCSRGKLQFSRHLQRHWTK